MYHKNQQKNVGKYTVRPLDPSWGWFLSDGPEQQVIHLQNGLRGFAALGLILITG